MSKNIEKRTTQNKFDFKLDLSVEQIKLPILFFLLLILNSTDSFSQNSISRVVYHAEHSFHSANSYNGQNTLHFNQNYSLFIHEGYPKESTQKQDGNDIISTVGDKEGAPEFINFKDSLTYTKLVGQFFGQSQSIIKEKMDNITWEVQDSQKNIKNFLCILATTEYEGRKYSAWFTPDIPVPFGPYRLRGLPGLILEAKSEDGKINWQFVGYEAKTTAEVKLVPPSIGELFDTLEEFVEAKIIFKLKKESQSTSEFTVTIGSKNVDAYIEKGKFNIYQKYMNKRK